ncbi:MAG: probable transposase [Leptospirillum rubarum]|uniref:Probable transposase n=1 Tax=Leptospirillum sp. Group II '5-way CG' TaxID=419541 RepID=B6AS79_9BACT|nr:MAG: probable transposase [Leptospirillum rubarum]EDZ38303.1 MAG: Probable transposase [Leptospirillum sp. Group II '5-way CG']
MSMNRIQFQKGLSLPEFQSLYGTEEQCEAVLEKTRWPDVISVFPGRVTEFRVESCD